MMVKVVPAPGADLMAMVASAWVTIP